MARYMAIIDVTGEAFGALLKNPHDRKKAIEPFFRQLVALSNIIGWALVKIAFTS